MSPLAIILIVLLLLVVLGGGWGYRSGYYNTGSPYGYGFGLIGIVLFVVLIMVLMGRIG